MIKVDNVTKPATYGSCLAIATLLRASKAQSNLRPRNIMKKGTKNFDQVKEGNKWPIYVPYILDMGFKRKQGRIGLTNVP